MNKKRIAALIALAVLTLAGKFLCAEPHWNNQTTFMAQDDGDSLRPFSVSIGTTTPVLVYYSTQTAAAARSGYASPDRVLTIQNPQAYNLFCSTSIGFSATAGNRFEVFSSSVVAAGSAYRGSNVFETHAAPSQIWCVFESAAGAGLKEILGVVGYDSGD